MRATVARRRKMSIVRVVLQAAFSGARKSSASSSVRSSSQLAERGEGTLVPPDDVHSRALGGRKLVKGCEKFYEKGQEIMCKSIARRGGGAAGMESSYGTASRTPR